MNQCKSCLGTNGGHFQHCEQYGGSNPKKPQCLTAAQCLKELARVMEQFGIGDVVEAINSDFIKRPASEWNKLPNFVYPELWSFAIAEVEGKPVFFDSILYDRDGAPYTEFRGDVTDLCTALSWLPPKPRTIMVEHLLEDVVALAQHAYSKDSVAKACRQALEREGVK